MPKFSFQDVGPCAAVWDYGGTPVIFRSYLGKFSFKHEDSVSPVHEEEYGDLAVDAVFAGGTAELALPIIRTSLEKLEDILPGSSLLGDVLSVFNKCGSAMYEDAKQLCIKPIKDNVVSVDPKEWILFYKVHPFKSIDLGYDRKEQRVILVKFRVFPMQESGFEGKMYDIGVAT